ncbi:hypothetical protein M0R45_027021 [Rubus argutus]|uniref:Uncharacterized protein n=1 Tax=Rubus argutus TaxID=59490 RepID=A0AAW1X2W2_RUBAR
MRISTATLHLEPMSLHLHQMPHSLATTHELTAPPMRTPLCHLPDLLLVIGDGDEDLTLLRGSLLPALRSSTNPVTAGAELEFGERNDNGIL